MRIPPIDAGRLSLADDGTPASPDFGDVYHSRAGALPQARHVFLGGNELPARWSKRPRFVILETGFGLGNNFLATWAAWRDDPQRCDTLVFLSIEKHPLTEADLRRAQASSPVPALAEQLAANWPPLTPDLHRLDFEGGRVQLHLAFGDARDWLPHWDAQVDAFFLDGFAPDRNPELWDARLFRQFARLAAADATAATWSAAALVREALRSAQFDPRKVPGFGGKRDMTVARFNPRAPARVHTPTAALRSPSGPRQAIIVGAGLAGCAAAWALHQQGWRCTIVDRHPAPAGEASGNEAGLFHGIVHAAESPHTRWHRASTLRMAHVARPWVQTGRVAGRIDGLLRLDARMEDAAACARLQELGLPETFVEWWPVDRVRALSGTAAPSGAWFFPLSGWLCPADVCRHLARAAHAEFVGGRNVAALHRDPSGWTVTFTEGASMQAETVVLAGALSTQALLEPWLPPGWLTAIRGQTTRLTAGQCDALRLRWPMAGAGYAIGLPDGGALCGATTQHLDADPAVRLQDHAHNLDQLQRLTGQGVQVDPTCVRGRTGWRASTRDRLPVVGPVPAPPFAETGTPLRHRKRLRDERGGLFVLTGLGSRGLGSAVLAAEVLASWVTGSPCPVDTDLRDAVDIARLFEQPGPDQKYKPR